MSPTSYLTAPPRGVGTEFSIRARGVNGCGPAGSYGAGRLYMLPDGYGPGAMAELTVYEKRTCTTCRTLAALLEEKGIDFERVDFHVEPLTEPEIRELVRKTGEPARNLFREREPVFEELNLKEREPGDDEAIALMAEHPPLMQRPVVVRGERAVLARPVERVYELFD
jgi:arsenate reductase (glutaredoxin)